MQISLKKLFFLKLFTQPVQTVRDGLTIAQYILRCKGREKMRAKRGAIKKSEIHRYIAFSYPPPPAPGNLGDNAQTIATKRAISQIDERAEFVVVPRHELSFYENQPPAICVMQGWFENRTLNFLPGVDVVPVWIGTHLTHRARAGLNFLMKFCPEVFRDAEIGCRDQSTLGFFRSKGIPAYFSRCLSLTLPRRESEPKEPRVFIVNCVDEIVSLIPQELKENAIFVDQRNVYLPGTYEAQRYEDEAKKVFARYRDEAGLVITSALHCAQPCIAMGIPVVFIDPLQRQADRFSTMRGIIPIWTIEDLKNDKVDFSPKAPEFEALKALLIENLDLSIRKAKGLPFDADRLTKIRTDIADFQTPESQKGVVSSS